MLRPKSVPRILFITVIAAASMASTAAAQRTWKLYDLRDLIGLLPPSSPSAEKAEKASDESLAAILGGGRRSHRPVVVPQESPAESVDRMMVRLCDALGVSRAELFAGVYGVEAEEAEHATLLGMLDKVRTLYSGRYAVDVLWYRTAADQVPMIGDEVDPSEPSHRHRLVLTRRTPTALMQVTNHTYLAGMNPVVAQSAVGYEPIVGVEESGLRLSLLVGAGDETEAATSILVTGDLRRVIPDRSTGKLLDGLVQNVRIELPEVVLRSIDSNIRIDFGKLTALGVVDGFDEDSSIVVAARVEKLAD